VTVLSTPCSRSHACDRPDGLGRARRRNALLVLASQEFGLVRVAGASRITQVAGMFNRIFSFFSDAILENCPNSASLGMDTTGINESVPDGALRAMRSSPDEPLSQSAGTWDPPEHPEHQGRCDSGGWG